MSKLIDHSEEKPDNRQKCEVWTRVMGYMRPLESFNNGKKQEFKDRTYVDATKK